MRIVIAGGGDTGVELAKSLIKEKHDVVLIEANRERAEYLAEKLDCLVIYGNASNPETLKEANVHETDYTIVLTGDDKSNIVIALLAKLLGSKNVIVKIEDPLYNDLLYAHGFEYVVNPNRLVVSRIMDIIRGVKETIVLTHYPSMQFSIYEITEKLHGKSISELKLDSKKARILVVFRGEEAFFAEEDTVLQKGDKVLVAYKPDYVENIDKIFREH